MSLLQIRKRQSLMNQIVMIPLVVDADSKNEDI